MKSQSLISPSVSALFESERAILKRITSLLFAIAGCSWFLLYLPESIIKRDVHEVFKLQQYQIYLLLLTLWGLDYKRQLSRITVLIQKALVLQRSPSEIESSDIINDIHVFEVLFFKKQAQGLHISLLITWTFLFLACTVIIKQFLLIFGLYY